MTATVKTKFNIRNSNNSDLEEILFWLKKESDENDGDGFYCNRTIIRQAHADNALVVLAVGERVVAFSVVDDRSWDILEVRPDCRGQGYGRELAQYCINQFRKNGTRIVKIECVMNSTPFWERMGFSINNSDPSHAYLLL